MVIRWGSSIAVGVAALLLLRWWRGFYWSHSVLVGLAIAALVYSGWRTLDRMRGNGS